MNSERSTSASNPAVLLFLGLSCLGCSRKLRVDLPTKNVVGTVTLDGTPVSGATVMYVPEKDDDSSRSAAGETDDEGVFKLVSSGMQGALPGNYKVVVTKPSTKNSIPKKYENPKKSPIKQTVASNGDNHHDIKLASR